MRVKKYGSSYAKYSDAVAELFEVTPNVLEVSVSKPGCIFWKGELIELVGVCGSVTTSFKGLTRMSVVKKMKKYLMSKEVKKHYD